MKCFYHSADLDGHCSGAIVKYAHPEAKLIGFNYGNDFPWDSITSGEDVVMVDVSLPIEDMVRLARRCKETGGQFYWIDHHISIIRDFDALPEDDRMLFNASLSTEKAACELCWEFFYTSSVPESIRLLGLYDSWRFTPDREFYVKSFQYGLRAQGDTRPEKSMPMWRDLFHDRPALFDKIRIEGSTILDYQLRQNEIACRKCAFETTLKSPDGNLEFRCIAINSNFANSDVFRSVYNPERHDAMLCFYMGKRREWVVSLYSTHDDLDCSAMALAFGGGGHKGAAGFRCKELPFE